MSLTFAVLHALYSVSGSPTAYRLGFGSPTRLGRFSFVGETASGTSISPDDASSDPADGALTRARLSSITASEVFFRLRLGGSSAGSASGSAWITIPCSGSAGSTSAFFRDLVFFTKERTRHRRLQVTKKAAKSRLRGPSRPKHSEAKVSVAFHVGEEAEQEQSVRPLARVTTHVLGCLPYG
jgi:hypothetical protein